MAFKFIAVLAFVAVASAGIIEPHYQQYHAAPVYHQAAPVYHAAPAVVKTIAAPVYAAKHVEYEAPAKYDFSYSVEDPHTGDIKSQGESRDGDAVHGSYSLIDADGYKRTVEYTADDHNGFNAVVHREPVSGHKVVAAPVTKYVAAPVTKYVAAPVTKYVAAPVAHYAHAAPVAHYAHAAPVAHYAHAAPVAHYAQAAPVAHYAQAAPVAHYAAAPAAHYAVGHDVSHVTVNSHASNYHY